MVANNNKRPNSNKSPKISSLRSSHVTCWSCLSIYSSTGVRCINNSSIRREEIDGCLIHPQGNAKHNTTFTIAYDMYQVLRIHIRIETLSSSARQNTQASRTCQWDHKLPSVLLVPLLYWSANNPLHVRHCDSNNVHVALVFCSETNLSFSCHT